jgi:predicted esterase
VRGGGSAAFTAAWLASAALAQPSQSGLQPDAVFSDYPPVAQSSQLIARLASPLTAEQMRRALAGRSLDERPLDLSKERFVLYVPAKAPEGGYGLLVFVPPWNEAVLPNGWQPVLDRLGVIFVAAEASGNDANVLTRREPLALIAEANVEKRYRIDPALVFVGGFSGGAHVAERLALAYPDIFSGALLDAGADPIGDHAAPLPEAELFARFQATSRIYLLTGSKDQGRLDMATDAVSSLGRWCVANTASDEIPDAGHRIADPAALERALKALAAAPKPDGSRLAACRARVAHDEAAASEKVETLLAAGRREEAKKALIDLDARFGGLAKARSVALFERLAGG